MIDNPLVSVVIPTYNRASYLGDAIDSVLQQTYANYEVIVVDDGSTDGTDNLIQTYGQRVRYIREKNQGVSVARNEGVRISGGDYIAFLDSDDIWMPDKLGRQISLLNRFPECDLSFSPAWIVNARLDRIQGFPLFGGLAANEITLERLYLTDIILIPTVLLRRDVFWAVGGFDPDIRFGEDWLFVLRLLSRGALVAYLSEPLASIRRHSPTQSHFPNLLLADQVLADHLTVLNRCFGLYPGGMSESLKRRALANQYVLGALTSLAVGFVQKSCDLLTSAFSIDPGFADFVPLYGQDIVNVAFDHAREDSGKLNHAKVVEFVESALEDRRMFALAHASFEKQIWAKVNLALALDAHYKADVKQCRKWLIRSIKLDPSCLSNAGITLMAIELFAGKSTASAVRKIGRKLLPAIGPDAFLLADTRAHRITDSF